jgi:hypothetical protein
MRDKRPRPRVFRLAARATALGVLLPILLGGGLAALPSPQKAKDVPAFLREIEKAVREIGGYPGEDFVRREFFLGVGDDDTYKTHYVGILIKDDAESSRMTIQVTLLEPSRDDPRVKYARDIKTIVCRFQAAGAEILRSDYSQVELETLLPDVLRAVVDKKNLLKKEPISP